MFRNAQRMSEGANGMADKITNANRSVRDPQRRITAATAIGMNALKPVMRNAEDVGRQH
jgi:hypothetical protein